MDDTFRGRGLATAMTSKQSYLGKLAVITGGTSGLGLALANRLAALGAKPILIDIKNQDTPYPIEIADVSDAEALAAAVSRIAATHGPIDLGIANAAIDMTGEAHTFTAADWRAIIKTNLLGATNLVSSVFPAMVTRRSGQLVLVSSGAGLIGFPMGAPYTTTKAGLIGMGAALRAEAARHGVSVCVACPPALDTPLLKNGKAKPGINRTAFLASLQTRPMPTDQAAKHILKKAAADKSPIIFPTNLWLGYKLAVLFPSLGEKIRADILNKLDRYGRS